MTVLSMVRGRLTLELPVPPSANRWWRTVNGHMVVSYEARLYQRNVWNLVLLQAGLQHLGSEGEKRFPLFPKRTPLVVTVRWFRAERRGDLDKRLGILLDALQGTVYANDSQVVALHAFRHDDPDHPRMVVEVAAQAEP